SKALQPLPVPLQTVSDHPRGSAGLVVRLVPPTAVTYREAAGDCTPNPASPEPAGIAMPGRVKGPAELRSALDSGPPEVLLITVAPRAAASSTAASRSVRLAVLASTRMM